MMDAAKRRDIERVYLMTSAQVGKSEVMLNVLGYFIHQDPSPILMVQPTIEMGEAFSKDRVAPMLRDTPALAAIIGDIGRKKTGNTLRHKKFPGGHLSIAGANSPASLASRPVRVALGDEVDRWPPSAGTEGDPWQLVIKRTATFHNRKLIAASTPTITDASRIERLFKQGDRRLYLVPCPKCGEKSPLCFSADKTTIYRHDDMPAMEMKFDRHNLSSTWFECPHCGERIGEGKKAWMLKHGEWMATAQSAGVASFHVWEAYSPWRRWEQVADAFLKAKDDPLLLQTFVNTVLGEPFEDRVSSISVATPATRGELYGAEVPSGALVLTAGIDVQDDRLEWTVYGWGNGEESWAIAHGVIHGNTAADPVWKQLDDVLINGVWQRADGASMKVAAACIDSGHRTDQVYRYVLPRQARRIYAVKGHGGPNRPVVSGSTKQKVGRTSSYVKLFTVGTDEAKSIIYTRLGIERPGPGYMHFPVSDDFDDLFFQQLTAEKCITEWRGGVAKRIWVKIRPRNEALDCAVYALAALYILRPNWPALSRRAGGASAEKSTKKRPVIRRKRGVGLKRW